MRAKLTYQIALQSALAVFGGMLAYALYQSWSGGVNAFELIGRHAWHSLALGLLIFLFLHWRLKKLVYDPIEAIIEHGQQMAVGTFEYRQYPRTDNELEEIMETMNIIAAHLNLAKQTPWKEYAETMERALRAIRLLWDPPPDLLAEIQMVRDNLRKMEFSISQNLPHKGRERRPAQPLTASGQGIEPSQAVPAPMGGKSANWMEYAHAQGHKIETPGGRSGAS
jgi:hypothetical protein